MKNHRLPLLLIFLLTLGIVSCKKNLPPVISLNGNSTTESTLNQPYQDPGANATDAKGKDISDKIVATGNVNIDEEGTYQIFYDVTDKHGNKAVTSTRVVKVSNSADFMEGLYNIAYSLSGTTTYSGSSQSYINVSNTINKRFYVNTPFQFYAEVESNGVVTVPLQGDPGYQVEGSGQVQDNGSGQINMQSQAYGYISLQLTPQ